MHLGCSADAGGLQHVGVLFRACRHSRAAARCCVSPSVARQLAARAVGEVTFSIGLRGGPVTAVFVSHVVALSHSGAAAAQKPQLSGTVEAAELFNVVATIRSSVSVTRIGGLVSSGLVRSAGEVAAVAGVASAPLGGCSETVVPSQQSVGPGLIRTFRSSVRFRRTAEALHLSRFGFTTVGVTTCRLTGHSDAVVLASVSEGAGSFDRPSNTQMEPSRPPDLCDPVTAARGSFATLDRRTKPRTSNHSDHEEHIWAAPPMRVVAARRGFVSGVSVLSCGGAEFGLAFGQPVNSGHEPSVRPPVPIGLGWSGHRGIRVARRGALGQRRGCGAQRQLFGTVDAAGCSTSSPPFVRACRSFGSLDSSRTVW